MVASCNVAQKGKSATGFRISTAEYQVRCGKLCPSGTVGKSHHVGTRTSLALPVAPVAHFLPLAICRAAIFWRFAISPSAPRFAKNTGIFLTYRLRLIRWPYPVAHANNVCAMNNAPPVHGCRCGGKLYTDGAAMRRHQAQDGRKLGGCDARRSSNAGQTLRPMRSNAHDVPALSGWPVLARVMLARRRTTAGERGTPCPRTHPHPVHPGASDSRVVLRTCTPTVSLTSLSVYEEVADTMVVKLDNALRSNARCPGRPMEDLPHGQHVALHRTRSPSRTRGSVQTDDHCGCPTPAPRRDGGQPCGRPWKEQRHHRSLVPRDALLTERSAFRLLALASPDWVIYGTS
jgi:hypothetical protein